MLLFISEKPNFPEIIHSCNTGESNIGAFQLGGTDRQTTSFDSEDPDRRCIELDMRK